MILRALAYRHPSSRLAIVTLDTLHDEERRIENRRIFEPRRLPEPERPPRRPRAAPGIRAADCSDSLRTRIASEHQRSFLEAAHTRHRAIEGPDFARCATRHLVQDLDFHIVEAALLADESAQPLASIPQHPLGHPYHEMFSFPRSGIVSRVQERRPASCARPSPSRFNPNTERPIARTEAWQMRRDQQERTARVKHVSPTGRGRIAPSPRNESDASATMIPPTPKVACTARGPAIPGNRRCSKILRGVCRAYSRPAHLRARVAREPGRARAA